MIRSQDSDDFHYLKSHTIPRISFHSTELYHDSSVAWSKEARQTVIVDDLQDDIIGL